AGADLEPQQAEVAQVLNAGHVEVGQVPAVVDDALRVRVREADPRERRELERRHPVGWPAELDHGAMLNPGTRSLPVVYWSRAHARCARPGGRRRRTG